MEGEKISHLDEDRHELPWNAQFCITPDGHAAGISYAHGPEQYRVVNASGPLGYPKIHVVHEHSEPVRIPVRVLIRR